MSTSSLGGLTGLTAFDVRAIEAPDTGRTHFEGTDSAQTIVELARSVAGESPDDARELLSAFVEVYPDRREELEALVAEDPASAARLAPRWG